jgi:hypothetical protein
MSGGEGWQRRLTNEVIMSENKNSLTDVINASGFLFQIKLEEEIRQSQPVSPLGTWQQIA